MNLTIVTYRFKVWKNLYFTRTKVFVKNESPEQIHSFLINIYKDYEPISIIYAPESEVLSLNYLNRFKR
jgi:hypothetical protein